MNQNTRNILGGLLFISWIYSIFCNEQLVQQAAKIIPDMRPLSIVVYWPFIAPILGLILFNKSNYAIYLVIAFLIISISFYYY